MTSLPKALRSLAVTAALSALVLGSVSLDASPADAAPRVSISVKGSSGLGAVADTKYLTELNLRGSGFQSIKNGFGGIYVLFGAATGTWQPSKGGKVGSNYRYVYDDESNPVGYQLFVSFPGSSTAYANNGGYLDADGTWSATIRIPGAKFQAYDRSGKVSTVDCTKVQCGIITIGAHGVPNSSNETFTPITFKSIYTAAEGRLVAGAEPVNTAVAPTVVGGRPATIPAAPSESAFAEAARGGVEVESGQSRLTVTLPGADTEAWHGVSFGEGPIFAGWFKPSSQGQLDVNLPENLPAGEHRLIVQDTGGKLLGWSSFERGVAPEADDAAEEPAAAVQPGQETSPLLLWAVIAVAVLAALSVIILLLVLLRGRRRAGDLPAAAASDDPDAATPTDSEATR